MRRKGKVTVLDTAARCFHAFFAHFVCITLLLRRRRNSNKVRFNVSGDLGLA